MVTTEQSLLSRIIGSTPDDTPLRLMEFLADVNATESEAADFYSQWQSMPNRHSPLNQRRSSGPFRGGAPMPTNKPILDQHVGNGKFEDLVADLMSKKNLDRHAASRFIAKRHPQSHKNYIRRTQPTSRWARV